MAACAVFIATVAFDELPFAEICGGFIGQDWYALGWNRQLVTENDLAEPGASQDGARA